MCGTSNIFLTDICNWNRSLNVGWVLTQWASCDSNTQTIGKHVWYEKEASNVVRPLQSSISTGVV